MEEYKQALQRLVDAIDGPSSPVSEFLKRIDAAMLAAKALLARPDPEHPKRLGWWVVFDEADDTGRIPDGFFIDECRAVNFHMEPGWRRNHLEAVGLLLPSPPAATGEKDS